MTTIAAICCSHSPLMLQDASVATNDEAKRDVLDTFARLARSVREFDPELIVSFAPDHYNGLFYDLMPSFCIGTAAQSTRDWGIARKSLNVPAQLSLDCARHIRQADLDIAISHDMWVDHGTTIPLLYLAGALDAVPVIPFLINCIAPPYPTFRRARQLGDAVGRFLADTGKRTLLIGSGGLSHAPPTPVLESATQAERHRLIHRHVPSMQDYEKRQTRVLKAARSLADPSPLILPPNEKWDRRFLKHALAADFPALEQYEHDAIETEAGHGAHELRCWLAAIAAAHQAGARLLELDCYRLVPDWITGMAIAHTSLDTPTHASDRMN